MKRILVTGSSRGLGLEFVRQLLARGELVFAACRQPEQTDELASLKEQHPERLNLIKLDVTKEEDIQAAVLAVGSQVEGLELLVNNAGVNITGDAFGEMQPEKMRFVIEINTLAPVLITQAFTGLLAKGKAPKVVNITSGLGSIEMNNGSQHSYSASKAALNMYTKSISFPLRSKGIIAIAMDPGWVQTDMGGQGAPLKPVESISGMLKVIDALSLKNAGRYLRYDGEELPW